jgi:protein-disulfide isomerase
MSAAGAALVSIAPFGRLSGLARAEAMPLHDDDRILGAADAPITMLEYSSLTCPHCATFHRESLPQIREKWVAEGKLRLVYRHFPTDGLALRAATLSNCIQGERFFPFLDLLFKNQDKWKRAPEPLKILGQYARLAGLSQERVDSCMADQEGMNSVLEQAQEGRTVYGVESTPTFVINGEKAVGALAFAAFESIFRKTVPDA